MSDKIDSRPATYDHINKVQGYIFKAVDNLINRALIHDQSKLQSPEVEVFDEYTSKLTDSTYGSDEYKRFLLEMKPALDHHYSKNSHHPEFHFSGIHGMSCMDLIEMLADWKAATLRHKDGNMLKSIEMNKQRFGYDDDFKQMLIKTSREMRLL